MPAKIHGKRGNKSREACHQPRVLLRVLLLVQMRLNPAARSTIVWNRWINVIARHRHHHHHQIPELVGEHHQQGSPQRKVGGIGFSRDRCKHCFLGLPKGTKSEPLQHYSLGAAGASGVTATAPLGRRRAVLAIGPQSPTL